MARKVNMAVLVAVAVAALLHCAVAETVHVVGGSTGWVIPSGGAATYTTWAASQTFSVGDILEFNFSTGEHDVAEVTKEAYDSCNGTTPVIPISYTGPSNITLTTAGEHYYMCTYSGHCDAGQKLAINVTAASSPSPSPSPSPSSPSPSPKSSSPAPEPSASTPKPSASAPEPSASSPKSAPAPGPSSSSVTYTVGDAMGWVVPSAAGAYGTWAANKTFRVGDTLVFNFAAGRHDVAEVSKTAYEDCNSTTTISKNTASPARITLTTAGEHYYICTFPGHCNGGQKLAINVTSGSSTATPPSTSTTPSTPSPTGSTTTPSTPSPTGSTTSPPPPESHAPSFAATGFFATFLSIAVAFLLY